MKVLLVIPAYNEEINILKVYKRIKKHFVDGLFIDYIVINDCSVDKTKQILENENIKHVDNIVNLGIGGTVQLGYKYAEENGYDIAVQFDGDGQHDINSLKSLLTPLIEGKCNMVIGSRFIEEKSEFKSTKMRQLGIKMISVFIKLFTGKKIYDTTSGFRAVDKSIISVFAKKYPVEYPEPVSTVELLKMGKIILEVPVKMHERTGGVSSIKKWKTVYYMINVLLSIVVVSFRRY